MSRSKTRFKFSVSFVVSYNYQECYYKPKALIIENRDSYGMCLQFDMWCRHKPHICECSCALWLDSSTKPSWRSCGQCQRNDSRDATCCRDDWCRFLLCVRWLLAILCSSQREIFRSQLLRLKQQWNSVMCTHVSHPDYSPFESADTNWPTAEEFPTAFSSNWTSETMMLSQRTLPQFVHTEIGAIDDDSWYLELLCTNLRRHEPNRFRSRLSYNLSTSSSLLVQGLRRWYTNFWYFFTPNNFPFSRTSKQRLVDKPGFELIRPRAISVSIGFWHHNTSWLSILFTKIFNLGLERMKTRNLEQKRLWWTIFESSNCRQRLLTDELSWI